MLTRSYDVKSQHINLDLSVVTSGGAWCNKIWQVSRFLLLAHQKVRTLCTIHTIRQYSV
jgi:hypothetical protein